MDLPDKTEGIPPPRKDVKPVVTGAVQVKRPATRRFFDYMFAESPREVGAKIGRDVIVPRIKQGVEAAFNEFLSGMLWGNSANRPLSNLVQQASMRGGGVNYNVISSGGSPASLTQAREANVSRSSGTYKDLVLPSQEMAEILLANMYDLLNQYRVVTVADLYELASLSTVVSDNRHGWTSLEGSRIMKVREGYLLELPRPTII